MALEMKKRMKVTRRDCCTKHVTKRGIQFHSSYRSTTFALERARGRVSHKGSKTAYTILELVHNFWIKSNPKKTCREKPYLKPDEEVLMFMCRPCPCLCDSSIIEKPVLARLSGYEKNGKAKPNTAARCLTIRQRQGETEKRQAVTLYVNELLIKIVNSKVDRSSFSHHGFPPVGPWHLVGATMDNTLD